MLELIYFIAGLFELVGKPILAIIGAKSIHDYYNREKRS